MITFEEVCEGMMKQVIRASQAEAKVAQLEKENKELKARLQPSQEQKKESK